MRHLFIVGPLSHITAKYKNMGKRYTSLNIHQQLGCSQYMLILHKHAVLNIW